MLNHVLFVDDEIHILRAIKRGLHSEKYKKFFANSGEEALAILEKEEIHVIVSDMKMPKMTGLELLTIVKEKYPEIVTIILSGYTQLQQIIVTINRLDIYKFITKPWDMEVEFKEVIQNAINLYNTRRENEQLKVSLEKKNTLYQNMIRSNSEKMSLMKNDFSFLETLNNVTGKFYYDMGIKLKRDEIDLKTYGGELSLVSHLYGQVVKLMPTRHDEFNTHIMHDTLMKMVKSIFKEKPDCEMEIITTNAQAIYKGELTILAYSIVSLIHYFFGVKDGDVFSLAISEKQDEVKEDEDAINLLMLLKTERRQIVTGQMRQATVNMFFSSLIQSYGGTFSVEEKKGEYLILLKFPFRRKAKLSDE